MKKFSIIILALIYFIVSSGFAMSVHYCMGKFASVDLSAHDNKCDKCGMKTTQGGCCKHIYKVIKITDSQEVVTGISAPVVPFAILNNAQIIFNKDFTFTKSISEITNHSPPPLQDISLCVLNCVFRI